MTGPMATVSSTAHDAVVEITVSGEIDMSNAADVERQLADAISNQAHIVRLDLAPVSFMDSAALRSLFALASRLDTAQITFVVIAPTGSAARRILELSGYDAIVTLAESG